LKFRFCAENVATAFGVQYQSGQKFYTRMENGSTVISSEPRGKAVPPHTYVTFAEALIASWMKSPGHRKNILNPEGRYFGASCLPEKKSEGIPIFYCVQVFFTPLQ
jgi:uncharacterized protein YkwD